VRRALKCRGSLSITCRHFTDRAGQSRLLDLEDILVVAPYNAQVHLLKTMLPDGTQVGTVDKFQGRQAPVVICSMTSSSGEEIPRGMEFLLSQNRLNVAVSRAQALTVMVASPELLTLTCRTVEQIRLVNGLCDTSKWRLNTSGLSSIGLAQVTRN